MFSWERVPRHPFLYQRDENGWKGFRADSPARLSMEELVRPERGMETLKGG